MPTPKRALNAHCSSSSKRTRTSPPETRALAAINQQAPRTQVTVPVGDFMHATEALPEVFADILEDTTTDNDIDTAVKSTELEKDAELERRAAELSKKDVELGKKNEEIKKLKDKLAKKRKEEREQQEADSRLADDNHRLQEELELQAQELSALSYGLDDKSYRLTLKKEELKDAKEKIATLERSVNASGQTVARLEREIRVKQTMLQKMTNEDNAELDNEIHALHKRICKLFETVNKKDVHLAEARKQAQMLEDFIDEQGMYERYLDYTTTFP